MVGRLWEEVPFSVEVELLRLPLEEARPSEEARPLEEVRPSEALPLVEHPSEVLQALHSLEVRPSYR